MSNPFEGIYFTKNDLWRTVGLLLVVVGQFMPRTSYELFSQKFETSELSLVGIAIAIIMPLLMRKFGSEK